MTLQHGMDTSDLDIRSVVLKFLYYFSVYIVRNDSMKDFLLFLDNECKQMLYQFETRWLSAFPAVERLIHVFGTEILLSFSL